MEGDVQIYKSLPHSSIKPIIDHPTGPKMIRTKSAVYATDQADSFVFRESTCNSDVSKTAEPLS